MSILAVYIDDLARGPDRRRRFARRRHDVRLFDPHPQPGKVVAQT